MCLGFKETLQAGRQRKELSFDVFVETYCRVVTKLYLKTFVGINYKNRTDELKTLRE